MHAFWCVDDGSRVARHSSAGLLLQGSQLSKTDFTRIFVLRSSLLTFDDAMCRQKFVFFRAISFFVESIFHGNPDANSCSSFFMQFIFHAAHFSCSLFFMQLIMSLRCRFQNFSCHSAGIVWLPLIMQVTVFRLALTVCDS
jgi:hypothetical protein